VVDQIHWSILMHPRFFLNLVCALVILIAVVGCGTAATPTKPAPTVAPQVITVIVTSTPLPATATPPIPPTITPMPTLALTQTVPISTPVAVKPTTGPVTPRATATKKPPTAPAVTATATPLPIKYAAPRLLEPIYDEAKGQRDERHYPGDALVLKWTSIGPIQADECYLITISFEPGQGDTFLVSNLCGDSTQKDYPVSFTINQPSRASPNYSSLWGGSDAWVTWSVSVVKNLGQKADKVHFNTAPLSPSSGPSKFLLKGSGN
jgi:hypothetical protein